MTNLRGRLAQLEAGNRVSDLVVAAWVRSHNGRAVFGENWEHGQADDESLEQFLARMEATQLQGYRVIWADAHDASL